MAKGLSDEDRVLWSLVARSAKPLKGRSGLPPEEPAAEPPASTKQEPSPSIAPSSPGAVAPKREQVAHKFDTQIRDKLSKGKLPIEGRVDLHGLTQDEAYGLLLSFLHRAHAGGVRYVLIITGKGSSSKGDGVLRRAVPAWLRTQPFRHLVSGLDEAARHHGGGGAIYVRLRRRETA